MPRVWKKCWSCGGRGFHVDFVEYEYKVSCFSCFEKGGEYVDEPDSTTITPAKKKDGSWLMAWSAGIASYYSLEHYYEIKGEELFFSSLAIFFLAGIFYKAILKLVFVLFMLLGGYLLIEGHFNDFFNF